MPYDPNRHHRRSIRLQGYDYTQHDRAHLFGAGATHASPYPQPYRQRRYPCMGHRRWVHKMNFISTSCQCLQIARERTMPHYDPEHHRRRSIRLKGYDYTQPGAYFITICTHERAHLFGAVVNGVMRLYDAGRIAAQCWRDIPVHFPHVQLDAFVVMPNHVHGVLWIVADDNDAGTQNVGATHASPLPPRGPVPQSIGAIIGQFKSAVTKRINAMRNAPGAPIWQRNYYEHIIRNERTLNAIRRYIVENPLRWHLDRYNTECTGEDPLAREIWDMIRGAEVSDRPPLPSDRPSLGGAL